MYASMHQPSAHVCMPAPEQVATEDDTEHKDEQADAQHDDVDVERKIVQLFRRHIAVWALQSYSTKAAYTQTHEMFTHIKNTQTCNR